MEFFAPWIRSGAFLLGLAVFLALELRDPYRPPSVSKPRRWINNLGLTLFNNLLVSLASAGALAAAAAYASQQGAGLLHLLRAPAWANALVTVLVLDLTLWAWHLLNHVAPLLWRFHRVHHTDLNMDVSTATRFHIGELAPSIVIKMAVIYALGGNLAGVLLFEVLTVLCAQFHHSSLRVGQGFERWFQVLFVPPSMHRIHHSVKIRERNSNYGTILSLWDRAMGTLLRGIDQAGIVIGVGGHFDQRGLDLPRLLAMPLWKAVR